MVVESVVLIVAIILAVLVFLRFIPLNLWISALASGVHVSIFTLMGMRIRRVPPAKIVGPLIKAEKAGLNMQISKMEAHFLAGGNLDRVITALITARGANIKLDFPEACAIDLAGRDVLQAVQMSVNPKVIETPVVAAIAKDGIELRAKARVTVRANIERLVGGAGEETIVARVGEGIVTTVGSAETHKAVLENPDLISRTVLSKGLDAGTAFEILSIDIADVDVGRNIGAQLQMDQAEADRRIAQAKAEERRAMAVAHEQEMIAAVQEMRAKVVEAEAEVPHAMAKALEEGKLGVMDYYQMQNVISDTKMREAISGTGKKAEDQSKTGKSKGEARNMGEMLRYLLVAAIFVMVQVAAGGKKKKKKGSPNRPPVKKNEAKQAAPTDRPEAKTAEESARVFERHEAQSGFDDPCDSEDAPRIHLHQADQQAMEQAGEGEDPCHAGAAPERPPMDDETKETDVQRAAFESDVLRGVVMSEVLTRPSERAALRRMKRGRRA